MTALVPITVSSQFDNSGAERVHAAPIKPTERTKFVSLGRYLDLTKAKVYPSNWGTGDDFLTSGYVSTDRSVARTDYVGNIDVVTVFDPFQLDSTLQPFSVDIVFNEYPMFVFDLLFTTQEGGTFKSGIEDPNWVPKSTFWIEHFLDSSPTESTVDFLGCAFMDGSDNPNTTTGQFSIKSVYTNYPEALDGKVVTFKITPIIEDGRSFSLLDRFYVDGQLVSYCFRGMRSYVNYELMRPETSVVVRMNTYSSTTPFALSDLKITKNVNDDKVVIERFSGVASGSTMNEHYFTVEPDDCGVYIAISPVLNADFTRTYPYVYAALVGAANPYQYYQTNSSNMECVALWWAHPSSIEAFNIPGEYKILVQATVDPHPYDIAVVRVKG